MASHSQSSYNRTPVLTVCQKHIPGLFLLFVDSVVLSTVLCVTNTYTISLSVYCCFICCHSLANKDAYNNLEYYELTASQTFSIRQITSPVEALNIGACECFSQLIQKQLRSCKTNVSHYDTHCRDVHGSTFCDPIDPTRPIYDDAIS